MKTTIKAHSKDLIVKPSLVLGFVEIHIQAKGQNGGVSVSEVLTADQAGALIFGIEQALEAAGIRRDQAVTA